MLALYVRNGCAGPAPPGDAVVPTLAPCRSTPPVGSELLEECGKGRFFRYHFYMKDFLKGFTELRPKDCGHKRQYWLWWRDKQISRRKRTFI